MKSRWIGSAVVAVVIIAVGVSIFLAEEPEPPRAIPAEVTPTSTPLEPVPVDYQEGYVASQGTFINLIDGTHVGTGSERLAMPALSLAKLYIAEYVYEQGDEEHLELCDAMISTSNDVYAEMLYSLYPESIDEVAKEFHLYSTKGNPRWGYSTTSTYDVAFFIAQLMKQNPEHPILKAMEDATAVAADGYAQDFGTAVLPRAKGTKWAWSDKRDLHSSVTFGDGWVAAATNVGSAEDLTEFVKAQMEDLVP